MNVFLWEYVTVGEQYGQIGFVMPRSIFSADQHDVFRQGKFLEITSLADLTEVSPLFNVPASVVLGRKTGTTSFPLKGYYVTGSMPERNLTLKNAEQYLSFQDVEYNIYSIGGRSFWGTPDEAPTVAGGRSYYYASFRQGATIVPRAFYFVEPRIDPELGLQVKSPFIKSARDAVKLAKKQYRGVSFEGRVDRSFLYATLLGSDVMPFTHTSFRVVILPLIVEGDRYRLTTSRELEAKGYSDTANWMRKAEKEWTIRRGEKAKKMSVYKWLDYARKMTSQSPQEKVRLLYNTSGTNISATIVTGPYTHNVNGYNLPLNGFISESKTYSCELRSKKEAFYLSAVLNSPLINDAIKPIQSRGLLGERDIHKKPLELPIPRYGNRDSAHRELGQLGSACSVKSTTILPLLQERYRSVAKIRGTIREELSQELTQINELSKQIMS